MIRASVIYHYFKDVITLGAGKLAHSFRNGEPIFASFLPTSEYYRTLFKPYIVLTLDSCTMLFVSPSLNLQKFRFCRFVKLLISTSFVARKNFEIRIYVYF